MSVDRDKERHIRSSAGAITRYEPAENLDIPRRTFIKTAAVATGSLLVGPYGVDRFVQAAPEIAEPETARVSLVVNGLEYRLTLDQRSSLLDVLRETLGLTGTKKGCDHGQCGACTVLVNGRRINSCLSFAAMFEGDEIVTVEGLSADALHPVQQAFLEHDAFQCGYCTPGQICSAVAALAEAKRGEPSAVTASGPADGAIELTPEEIRERMSGNICRCGAYPNILAAVRAAHLGMANS
jgi:xanthine dehydrogenase YagT iron-sulfur-binding subunit